MALRNLARFMNRHGVSYGPDSSGCPTWQYPDNLSRHEVDALFEALLPLVPSDVYELVKTNPARVVTAGNLCAPYETKRRT